jgi:hypothetical protein
METEAERAVYIALPSRALLEANVHPRIFALHFLEQ